MKQSILIVLISSIIVLFSGCDDGSTTKSSVATSPTSQNIPMEMNRTYEINKGDKIQKLAEETVIKIVSDLNHSKTTATLLKGEADIVRANQ